ncbi:hypothetical protein GGS26DRAFT_596758 [Hypomontagnella submonticulosa]|nr:hypothetical protein GGS26DRAFT_596758 [Hypomontagnella submonticulosa]
MGDAVGDFGSMPTVIKRLLEATGLVWLMQPKKRQTIPQFWIDFDDTHTSKKDETNTNVNANDNDDDIVVAKIHESMIKIEAVGQKVIEEIQTSLTTGDSSILTKMDEMNKNIDKVAKQRTTDSDNEGDEEATSSRLNWPSRFGPSQSMDEMKDVDMDVDMMDVDTDAEGRRYRQRRSSWRTTHQLYYRRCLLIFTPL